MPDFECTWWPDNWLGVSLTECCVDHDLGGSDWALAKCVAAQTPADPVMALLFTGLGLMMFVGVTFGRPIYLAWKNRKN